VGFALISIQVLAQADAESNPVGDAQDEPNEDPVLVKPTEGRGYTDALKGIGMNVSLPKINFQFDFYKKIMIAIVVIVILAIIGFCLMYFK
jgi:hypothetical protein